jgi:hypothetical protein
MKSIYYWSKTHIEDIREYYESRGYQFVVGRDQFGKWLIAGVDIDGNFIDPGEHLDLVTHESFCPDVALNCITLALVDSSQPNFFRLAVSSPGFFRNDTLPSYLSSVPKQGTLIVFTYFREDWW